MILHGYVSLPAGKLELYWKNNKRRWPPLHGPPAHPTFFFPTFLQESLIQNPCVARTDDKFVVTFTWRERDEESQVTSGSKKVGPKRQLLEITDNHSRPWNTYIYYYYIMKKNFKTLRSFSALGIVQVYIPSFLGSFLLQMCTNKRLLYYEDQNHFFYWIGWLECLILFSQASWFSRNRSLPRQARFLNNRAYDRAHMFALLQKTSGRRTCVDSSFMLFVFVYRFFLCTKGAHQIAAMIISNGNDSGQHSWPTRIRFVWAGLLCTWAMSFFLYRVLELGFGEKTGPLVVLVSSLGPIPVFFF